MAETSAITYLRLFEIRLLHHYWLDDGATIFDLMTSQDQRERRLLDYDVRGFLKIAPTASTAGLIAGLKGVFKETATGCVVGVPKDTVLAPDTTMEFAVTVTDGAFYNYTAFTLRPQKIYEVFYKLEKKSYRFKENVPVLSNLTGASRTTGGGKDLYLSKEYAGIGPNDPIESLVVSGPALLQLSADQPGAGTFQIAPDAGTAPVFLNQSDIPPIVPPPGLNGAPPAGITLSDGIPDAAFALVRLSAVRQNDGDFSFVGNNGKPKASPPVFQLRIKNRSTTWRYLDNRSGVVDSEEPNPLPLTYYGNAGTRQKPSQGVVKPTKINDRVTGIVSEIFV